MIFVAPVFWMAFPAILKGGFERVFAYAVVAADNDQRRSYLDEAYQLARAF